MYQIILIILLNIVFSQTTGKISGTIKDQSSSLPIIGANIIIINQGIGAATDLDGNFFILNVDPGLYDLRVDYIGYESKIIKDIQVSVNRTTTRNIVLKQSFIEGAIVEVTGNAVDIKPILRICKSKNIKVVEDASESLGTFYRKKYLNGKHTGTIGDFGCLSFNGNKIITTGGGGAVLTNSKKFYDYCNYLCDQAKDNSLLSIHNEVGFNYKLSNVHSAIGCSQMGKLRKYLKKKKMIHNNYCRLFQHSSDFEILNSSAGLYEIRVFSLNAIRRPSNVPVETTFQAQGKTAKPANVQNLRSFISN